MQRKKGFMSKEIYTSIINQASKLGFTTLDIRNMGEPLMDKHLPEKVQYARNQGFRSILIHTNGSLLNRKILDALGDSGMTMIIISLSPETEFEKSRPGIKFETMKKIITDIATSPYRSIIKVDYLKTGLSGSREDAAFKTWLEKEGFVIREKIQLHNWAKGTSENTTKSLCHRLWTSVTILWDGQICLCCLDYEGEINIGNIQKDHLIKLLNGSLYKQIRKNHLQGKFLQKCSMCDMVKVKDG
jgi:radical SAM protein with 4Fe4S-binding SPASM domain